MTKARRCGHTAAFPALHEDPGQPPPTSRKRSGRSLPTPIRPGRNSRCSKRNKKKPSLQDRFTSLTQQAGWSLPNKDPGGPGIGLHIAQAASRSTANPPVRQDCEKNDWSDFRGQYVTKPQSHARDACQEGGDNERSRISGNPAVQH